tara:strand:- start:1414 stop:2526 length:1113 start_codon:yes stop_codon:yes gene_type:complete
VSDPRDFLLSSYDFELPDDLIAQEPSEPRHASRMLIVQNSLSRHKTVWDWQDELKPGDLIVVNNTRVIKARLRVRRAGGGLGELLLLEPKGEGKWLCLAKPAKRMKIGDYLFLEAPNQKTIKLKVFDNDLHTGGRIINFPPSCFDIENIQKLLDLYGEVPLPPYIKTHNRMDSEKYQTRYASNPGAVAAPTAGLHLSDELLMMLNKKGIEKTQVTLHIGLGTFKPLEKQDLKNIKLHNEWVEVREEVVEAISSCRARGGRVIGVGTTTVRALEAAFVAGSGKLKSFQGMVDLVIQPGYSFGVVDALLTNFHLPKSSLMLLISALIGRKKLLNLYKEAIDLKYRFFSYGDAMWIPPEVILDEAKFQLEEGV